MCESNELIIKLNVEKEKEGTYFPLEFQAPENVEQMEISYQYLRYEKSQGMHGELYSKEINIVDFAICAPHGVYIGGSGSDRNIISLSAYGSSQGFAPCEITPGIWQIIVGAYKIAPEGCQIEYRIVFKEKKLRLYKGDTHIHTTGSDGNCNLHEIAQLAVKEGLDYVCITDHNNYTHNMQLPKVEGLTMLPGTEWTHYKGHAGMLGVEKPFDNAFCVNTQEEMEEKFLDAKERGALRVLNHPFCPNCGWRWGMDAVEYDLIEIWNGAVPRQVNEKCLKWWDLQLKKGARIPVIGGSDFHKIEFGRMIASPCTCLYAASRTRKDLIQAIAAGHGFVVYSPDGPMVEASAGECLMGDILSQDQEIAWRFWNLRERDQIVFVSDQGEECVEILTNVKEYQCLKKVIGLKYIRVEIRRDFGGDGSMLALITNPFYICNQD